MIFMAKGLARTAPAIRLILILSLASTAWAAMPHGAGAAELGSTENAHKKSYGDQWECDAGYQVEGDRCIQVAVPDNAYATGSTYGKAWECERGFEEVDRSFCRPIVLPEGSYLDAAGFRWKCKRGFRKTNSGCERIELPKNAYLTENNSGSDWACERKYQRIGDSCEIIEVPENAFLTNSDFDDPWKCERGFVRSGQTCRLVEVPENAFLDERGYEAGWICERGYRAEGEECVEIKVPTNAHLGRSGNRWECDRNFERSRDGCSLKR